MSTRLPLGWSRILEALPDQHPAVENIAALTAGNVCVEILDFMDNAAARSGDLPLAETRTVPSPHFSALPLPAAPTTLSSATVPLQG